MSQDSLSFVRTKYRYKNTNSTSIKITYINIRNKRFDSGLNPIFALRRKIQNEYFIFGTQFFLERSLSAPEYYDQK